MTRKAMLNAIASAANGECRDYVDSSLAHFSGRSIKSSPGLQWNFAGTHVQPMGKADLRLSGQARYTDDYYRN